MGFDPMTHRPRTDIFSSLPHLLALANLKEIMDHPSFEEHAARLQAEAVQIARLQYLHFLFQPPSSSSSNGPNNISTNFTTDMDTINLLNSLTGVKDLSGSLGSASTPADHHQNLLQSVNDISVPFSHLPDLQVPCSATTTTPQTSSSVITNKNSMAHEHGQELTTLLFNQSHHEGSDPNSPWFPSPSPTSATPPTRNGSISNLLDACSASSYGDVGASVWPDLLLEDTLFHDL